MNLNILVDIKNQNDNATAYYEGNKVLIQKIYLDSSLVDVVDLNNGNTYTLHSSKLNEDDTSSYYFL